MYQEIADRMTAAIRSGETWFPSNRANMSCHRNTMTKVNKVLRSRGLITPSKKGERLKVVQPQQSLLGESIEALILSGLSPEEITQVVTSELEKRRSVTVVSKQANLIESELIGIPISSSGLKVSDDPDGEFHLKLTDFAKWKRERKLILPNTIGIITQSDYYFLQAKVGMGENVICIQGNDLRQKISIAKLCRVVIVDTLNTT